MLRSVLVGLGSMAVIALIVLGVRHWDSIPWPDISMPDFGSSAPKTASAPTADKQAVTPEPSPPATSQEIAKLRGYTRKAQNHPKKARLAINERRSAHLGARVNRLWRNSFQEPHRRGNNSIKGIATWKKAT